MYQRISVLEDALSVLGDDRCHHYVSDDNRAPGCSASSVDTSQDLALSYISMSSRTYCVEEGKEIRYFSAFAAEVSPVVTTTRSEKHSV